MILLSILFAALMIFAAKTLFKLNWWLFKVSLKFCFYALIAVVVCLLLCGVALI
ncbi:MAG: hypothetical protein KBT31_03095 [Firmicutes bacterium]|nr:hypothetical protein [Candidatus Colimorpha enterica]